MNKWTATCFCFVTVLFSNEPVRAADPEPTVQGKTLSQWLKDLKNGNDGERTAAANAIAQLGPRANSAVLALREAMVNYDNNINPGTAAAVALWKVDRQAFVEILKNDNKRSPGRNIATLALLKIGSEAREVTPIILERAKDLGAVEHEHSLWALAHVAAPAVAVPVLIEGLAHETGQYSRMVSTWGLRDIGPVAKDALPALHRTLQDPDAAVRIDAAHAIWHIEHRANAILPVLIASLRGDQSLRSLRCLKQMGLEAKGAFPQVLELWRTAMGHEKKAAAETLLAIDAKAAEAMGVSTNVPLPPARALDARKRLPAIPTLALLIEKTVQDDLQLDQTQLENIRAFEANQRELFRQLGPVTSPEQSYKRREVMQAGEEAAAAILRPEQQKRIAQIVLQVRGLSALNEPSVARQLGLTLDQREELGELRTLRGQESRQEVKLRPRLEINRKNLAEIDRKYLAKGLERLTDEQKAKWRELTGKPIEIPQAVLPPRYTLPEQKEP